MGANSKRYFGKQKWVKFPEQSRQGTVEIAEHQPCGRFALSYTANDFALYNQEGAQQAAREIGEAIEKAAHQARQHYAAGQDLMSSVEASYQEEVVPILSQHRNLGASDTASREVIADKFVAHLGLPERLEHEVFSLAFSL